ncbi:unnamed protein product [Effrenium voratum]|uniref:catechol O-methyltransferase n=1 Tax=Effrenium voratum TaxID=2562239 RepID=A0AA36JMZ4_9DINO|nr:unnamed protein product [Effrenium voratum]
MGVAVFGTLLAAMEQSKKEPQEVLQLMRRRLLELDIITASHSMSLAYQDGRWHRAVNLYHQLLDDSLRLDSIAASTAASAAAAGHLWRPALQLMRNLAGRLLEVDARQVNVGMAVLGRGQHWDSALNLLDKYPAASRDGTTHNALLAAVAKGVQWLAAVLQLEHLQVRRVRADAYTYSTAISACCDAWREACHVLEMLQAFSEEPPTMAFNAATSACSKGDQWQRCFHLLGLARESARQSEDTQDQGLTPGFNAAIQASARCSNLQAGLQLWNQFADGPRAVNSCSRLLTECEQTGDRGAEEQLLAELKSGWLWAQGDILALLPAQPESGQWQAKLREVSLPAVRPRPRFRVSRRPAGLVGAASSAGFATAPYAKELGLLLHVLQTAEAGSPSSVCSSIESFGSQVLGKARAWLKVAGSSKASILTCAAKGAVPNSRVLEIGTYCGYSALQLAVALPKARIVSVDVDPAHVLIARNVIAFAGLEPPQVVVWTGHSTAVLMRLCSNSTRSSAFGAVFMDQRGSLYHEDLHNLERSGLLRPGAVVIADNVLKPGAPLLLWRLATSPKYSVQQLSVQEFAMPVEDWMAVAVVKDTTPDPIPAKEAVAPESAMELHRQSDEIRARALLPGQGAAGIFVERERHLGDVWQELIGEDWKDAPQVRVKSLIEHAVRATSLTAGALPLPARDRPSASSKPASSASKVPSTLPSTLPPQSKQAFAVDTVQIRGGFHTPELNAVYFLDSSLQIGSRATYWDERRRFFMYYQAALKRWAISVHDAESTGEDMLENAKRGGLCGFAFEVDKSSNQWMEHCEGKWINVKIDIQKLCTGRRASVTQDINKSLLTSSTPRVPETPETRDTSREVTFAMPLKAASALVPAAPAASVAPAAPVAPGATVAAPARASVAPVTAPSAAAPVVASPPAPKTDSPMVAQLVLAEAETTAPDMRQGHEEKNLQAEQEAEGGEDELSTDPEVKVEKDKKERKKDKDSKKAKKLEKQERARRKENKLKEKLRQEMLAARANKSKVRGEHVSKKQSASPKKRHEADKAKRRRVEASAAEKPAAKGAPRSGKESQRQTADSPETAMVPWQPSREDAVPLGPAVAVNPFWSEKAKEEAQLKALRPKDLPEVEEEQGSLVSPGALPVGSIYSAEIPAGGLDELLGAFKQVITQNQALWQEMKSLKEQVREGGGSKAMKVVICWVFREEVALADLWCCEHDKEDLEIRAGTKPQRRWREPMVVHRPEEDLGSVEQMMVLEGFILNNLEGENLVVEVRIAEVGKDQEILLKERYYLAMETGGSLDVRMRVFGVRASHRGTKEVGLVRLVVMQISIYPAEGFMEGGPIALVDPEVPVEPRDGDGGAKNFSENDVKGQAVRKVEVDASAPTTGAGKTSQSDGSDGEAVRGLIQEAAGLLKSLRGPELRRIQVSSLERYPSYWAWDEWKRFKKAYKMKEYHFDQGPFGHAKTKPTTIGTNMEMLEQLDGVLVEETYRRR